MMQNESYFRLIQNEADMRMRWSEVGFENESELSMVNHPSFDILPK